MTCRIHRHADAASFLSRAEAWLLRSEAEHNLILGIAHRLSEAPDSYEPPIYLATIQREDEEGEIVGCAFRTPPYKLGITGMPGAALPALAADVADVYEALPAVLGPAAEAQRFAELWSRIRGVRARPGMRQRVYQLDAVQPPEHRPPGGTRKAGVEDVGLVADWMAAFSAEAGVPSGDPRRQAEERIREGAIFLWEDDQPVSMAGAVARTPTGVRIGYVYTPPELRGRGYATIATTALSQRLLDAGFRFCFLYTNLANPTSNRIYQRIGYRAVCDVVDYDFDTYPETRPRSKT